MKEFYPGVSYYGHGNIIRKYSNFPHRLPLPVSIQHGWMMNPIPEDARRDALENWYWSPSIAKKFKDKYQFIKYRITGSPFLYCLRNAHIHVDEYEQVKKGSIVFPFHSTEKIKLHSDNERYCQMLNELPDDYKPITICIYHNDKKNGVDLLFSKYGFEIVCNGDNPCDDKFLYNFIKNVRCKRYLLTNEWSSAIHYASVMGCMTYIYGPKVSLIESTDKNFSDSFRNYFELFNRENREYYSISSGDQHKQYDIAFEELGMRYVLSKMKMRLLLWRLIFTPQYFSNLLSLK